MNENQRSMLRLSNLKDDLNRMLSDGITQYSTSLNENKKRSFVAKQELTRITNQMNANLHRNRDGAVSIDFIEDTGGVDEDVDILLKERNKFSDMSFDNAKEATKPVAISNLKDFIKTMVTKDMTEEEYLFPVPIDTETIPDSSVIPSFMNDATRCIDDEKIEKLIDSSDEDRIPEEEILSDEDIVNEIFASTMEIDMSKTEKYLDFERKRSAYIRQNKRDEYNEMIKVLPPSMRNALHIRKSEMIFTK